MSIRCCSKNINIDTKRSINRTQENALKMQLAQNIVVGTLGFINCIWSAASSDFSGGVSANYTNSTKTVEDKKTEDSANVQKEVENILGKEDFNKLPKDMQDDILNKFTAYKNVLNLEGEALSDRVKNYVKALQAHETEVEMGDFNKELFENALKEVAKNPEEPTAEEIQQAQALVRKNKQECDIKIEDANIEEQRKNGTDEEYFGAMKDRGVGYVDMYDKNNDEAIDFNEFKALEEKDLGSTLNEEEKALTQEIFNKIDKDKNGKLDANEMASHLYAVSRMHDTGQGPNTVSDITFQEWVDSQQILEDKDVADRYNVLYNQLYGVLKPQE